MNEANIYLILAVVLRRKHPNTRGYSCTRPTWSRIEKKYATLLYTPTEVGRRYLPLK